MSVSDDGIGISADDIPRLGTPFVQVDSSYERRFEGTGLGLSIVKGLAALHGGTLSINSTVGVGTTVTVTLPLAEGESRDGAAAASLRSIARRTAQGTETCLKDPADAPPLCRRGKP